MKVLIWTACFILYIAVLTIISTNGIVLGGIPAVILFSAFTLTAKFLCHVYTRKKEAKELREKMELWAKENDPSSKSKEEWSKWTDF